MIKIMRGIIILMGILLIFILLTACTSDSAFTRRDKTNQRTNDYNNMSEDEEYTYNDGYNSDNFSYEVIERSNKTKNSYTNDRIKKDNNNNDLYYQVGYASWYGREFHGRKTASGERFNMNRLTAAHKKLPFGTQVLVKNLENDKSVKVTINDRGPYRKGRIIDLSYAAAKKLGIIASGEARVGITIIRKGNEDNISNNESDSNNTYEPIVGVGFQDNEDNTKGNYSPDSYTYSNGNYSIQAGAFYSRRNAERFQKRLEGLVDNPVIILNENDMYKVRIEKLSTKNHANSIKSMLESEDISSFIIENKE